MQVSLAITYAIKIGIVDKMLKENFDLSTSWKRKHIN